MAHIVRFRIDGLAGRSTSIQFELNRDVNVFWGLNGAGKTSLLKILHGALDDDAEALARLPFAGAEVEIYSAKLDATIIRTYAPGKGVDSGTNPFEYLDPESPEWMIYEDEILRRRARELARSGPLWRTKPSKRSPKGRVSRLQHGYLPISRVGDARGISGGPRGLRDEAISDTVFDKMFAQQVRQRWSRYNASSTARINFAQQQGIAEILSLLFSGVPAGPENPARNIEIDAAYELVSEFLERQHLNTGLTRSSFKSNYIDRAELRDIVHRISKVTDIIRDALRPQEEFASLIGKFYSGNKEVSLEDGRLRVLLDGGEIPLESLSSGEKQWMQILLEVMSCGRNTMIVDEPELSMHVDWQNSLVNSMQVVNPEAQLILATHSPEVMANLEDRMVFEL